MAKNNCSFEIEDHPTQGHLLLEGACPKWNTFGSSQKKKKKSSPHLLGTPNKMLFILMNIGV